MVTLLFATHNGAATLPTMLGALTQIEHPSEWQVIVVDNASSDSTLQILESFREKLPLHILREPRRGKNSALNTGLQHASGDLIVFTDDDVIPHADWLSQMCKCAEANPDYDVFGGRILPHWSTDPDPVVMNNAPLGVTYALTPDEQVDGPVFPGLIWGPNMAVRKSVFAAGHRFNESVGPTGGNYIMGSETEFTIRIHRAGHKSWFCDAARVKHIIRTHQMSRDWVVKRAYRFGRNQWVQESGSGFSVPCIAGIPRWRLAALGQQYALWGTAALRGDANAAFRARWEIHFLRGFIREGLKSWGAR
jgi:glycosyltransferase involved in cell wall biosynthesis